MVVLSGNILGTGIFEYHFQFSLSSRCTLALYEEQAFWDTFSNYPYQEGVLTGIHMRNRHFGMPFSIPPIKHVYSGIILGTGIWDTFFNSPYQEGVLWHYMRNMHFGIPFSISSIKRVYSLPFI